MKTEVSRQTAILSPSLPLHQDENCMKMNDKKDIVGLQDMQQPEKRCVTIATRKTSTTTTNEEKTDIPSKWQRWMQQKPLTPTPSPTPTTTP